MDGKQRYAEFIREYTSTLRTGSIVWSCLIVIAGLLVGKPVIGIIVTAVAVVLAVYNVKSWMRVKNKLDIVEDKEYFYRQIEQPEDVFYDFKMMILREYILSAHDDIGIYPVESVDKIEVGLQEVGYKPKRCIFLTTKNGIRHMVALVYDGQDDTTKRRFEEVYQALKQKIEM